MKATVSALIAVALAATPAFAQQPTAPIQLKLLAINDFHGALEPPIGGNGVIGGVPAGGAEYLATHLSQALKSDPDALIVAAGDLMNASPLLSALFHDEPTVEALNAMGLAVSAVGNHEFDEGPDEMLRIQNGGCGGADAANKCRGGPFKGAAYTYLSANVVRAPSAADVAAVERYNAERRAKARGHDAICARPPNTALAACGMKFQLKLKAAPQTGATLFKPYVIRTVKGVKVGIIGETLKGTPAVVVPSGVAGLTFLDEAETANRYAAELKAQGVKAIVLLLHEGGIQAPGSNYNGCTGLRGAIVPIIDKLSPDIRVVVSAHSHASYNCKINGRVLTSGSAYGRLITHISLSIDPVTGEVADASATNAIVTRDAPKSPAVTAIIAKYQGMAAPLAGRVVGTVTRDLSRIPNGAGESALGDVLADAQLASTAAPDRGGAVIAFMNTGGIRADISAARISWTEKPGEVTFSELFDVQPFANVMTVLTLKGSDIKDLLEQQFDNPSPGRTLFLQVSDGFTYSYRLNAPAGQHVDPASIKLRGVTLSPQASYRVAQNNFIAGAGDNYSAFSRGVDQVGGEVDIDVLESWFKTHSPVQPGPQIASPDWIEPVGPPQVWL